MKLRYGAALLLVGLALQPGVADAAWWNPFKKDTPPTDGNAQNTPVPPVPLNAGAGAANTGLPPSAGVGAGPVGASNIAPASAPPVAAAAPVASSGDPVSVRLDRAEAQIRALTGQVEQLTFQLRQAQDQLQQLRGGSPAPSASAATGRRSEARPPADAEVVALGHTPDVNLKEVPMDGAAVVGDDAIGNKIAKRGEPPKVLGTVPANGTPAASVPAGGGVVASAAPPAGGNGQPLSLAPPGAAANAPPAGPNTVASLSPIAGIGDPRSTYEAAYQKILTGDYGVAEKGLQNFLAAYPTDKLAPDAQYWLGETYYARTMYREAAAAFLNGYKAYPKSAKAPENLLKLGLSLKGLGQRDEACNTFAEVLKRYPKSSNAMLQRVKAEQTSASCS